MPADDIFILQVGFIFAHHAYHVSPAVVGSHAIMRGLYPLSNATLSGGGAARSMCIVLCESRGRAMSEATTDQETGPTTERKPIGGDEADFEAVLIDGHLGF